MSIIHDGFSFSFLHGAPRVGPWSQNIQRTKFAGVVGESHLIDERGGREIAIDYLIDGKASEAALDATITALGNKTGKLTGTLRIDTGSQTTYQNATFLGYVEADRFRDGVTGGWVSKGQLRWRQRGPRPRPATPNTTGDEG